MANARKAAANPLWCRPPQALTCRNIPTTFRHAANWTNPSQRSRTKARLCVLPAKTYTKSPIVCSTQKLPERAKGELRELAAAACLRDGKREFGRTAITRHGCS